MDEHQEMEAIRYIIETQEWPEDLAFEWRGGPCPDFGHPLAWGILCHRIMGAGGTPDFEEVRQQVGDEEISDWQIGACLALQLKRLH